jgi:hypothetical protein
MFRKEWCENEKKFGFWSISNYLEHMVILCGESIARIPEAWKRLLDPDSGNGVDVLKRKWMKFDFPPKTGF